MSTRPSQRGSGVSPPVHREQRRDIPFARPDVSSAEVDAVSRVVRSGWLTTGPETAKLEAEFAATVSAEQVVAVNSATAAMHLALLAWGIGPGDEVITTPLTFCSTAHVVEHVGARPVFADIGDDFNIDPAAVEAAITHRTRAVMPVHYAGMSCDLPRLKAIATARGLYLLEDAAHAIGSSYDGVPIGAAPSIAAFSLYATKPVAAGEGGLLTCDSEALANTVRSLSLHGMSQDAWRRYEVGSQWSYDVTAAGFKYNLSDVLAALARAQLTRMRAMQSRRRRIAARYDEAFTELHPAVRIPPRRDAGDHSWHLYVLRISGDRDAFARALIERGVGISVHFRPVHLLTFYRERYQTRAGQFPAAEAAGASVLSLPIYSTMTDDEVDYVIDQVRSVATRSRRP